MDAYPFDEVAATASMNIRQGHLIYQQFVCDACGQKQTMTAPNVLYTSGQCSECGHVTDLRAAGCNYLLMAHRRTLPA